MVSFQSLIALTVLALIAVVLAGTAPEETKNREQLAAGKVTVRAACGAAQLEQCAFKDQFGFFNAKRWQKSANYANEYPFNSWWSPTSVFVNVKQKTLGMSISRSYNPEAGLEFASGEVKSRGRYGYGCYEARMKPISQPGVISAFLIHTDEFNAAKGRPILTNSVNLGFLWNNQMKRMTYRVTFIKNGQQGQVQDVFPKFDVSKSFHNYGFKFTPNAITWYLDGEPVFSASQNTPKLADGPFRIIFNTWVTDPTSGFGGRFTFQGRRVTRVAAVRFTRGVGCTFKPSF